MRDNTPKSTRTQGGDPIADYIRADTRLPAYLPYPRFLLKMEISQTAKLLYSLLLDRSTLCFAVTMIFLNPALCNVPTNVSASKSFVSVKISFGCLFP